jgi:cytochrome c biogenesis protein
MSDGVVLQDLPFDVELKKFIVEYYSTGMPKLFASEIVIHDHEPAASTAATVKVNDPAFHRGMAIYQSSFDDGGSAQAARPADGPAASRSRSRHGRRRTANHQRTDKLTLEFTGAARHQRREPGATTGGRRSGADVRKVDLGGSLSSTWARATRR